MPDATQSSIFRPILFKGSLSGLRKLLANESPLKIMKNTFYLTLKSLFVVKLPKFWF